MASSAKGGLKSLKAVEFLVIQTHLLCTGSPKLAEFVSRT